MFSSRPLLCLMLLALATPALALESGSRLVPGGSSTGGATAESFEAGLGRTFLPLQSRGGAAIGIVAEPGHGLTALPFSSGYGPLAVGGYVSYGLGDALLSSSFRSDGTRNHADLTAAYHTGLFGADSTAALSVGARWDRPLTGFSLNPAQPTALTLDSFGGRRSDVSVGLTLTHQITPSLSFGGVAQASQPTDGGDSGSGLLFGAGMGLRF